MPSPHNRLLNAAVVPMIVLLAVTMLWRTSAWLWPATDLPLGSGSAAFRIFWICDLVTNCFIILAIVDGVVYSTQRQRIQMQWIGSTVVIALLIEMLRGLYFSVSGSSPEVLEMLAFPIESVMVLGAAYAVLKYRLIDFEFVFSRAAVFTGVSAVLVLVFLALEWIAANVGDQLLGLAKLDASVERYSGLFAALVAGLLARPVHAVVDRALNRIFFARQRRDEEELRRFAREAEVATDHAQLIDAAFEIARKHVDATFVAVFVREGHGYRCTHTTGDAPRPPLQENDPIVLRMRRFGDPFELEDGERDYHHCVFFPMTVLGRLVAFFVCGPKQDRTHYTEREMETFTVFAQRVGTAYAWLSETSAPKKPIAV